MRDISAFSAHPIFGDTRLLMPFFIASGPGCQDYLISYEGRKIDEFDGKARHSRISPARFITVGMMMPGAYAFMRYACC